MLRSTSAFPFSCLFAHLIRMLPCPLPLLQILDFRFQRRCGHLVQLRRQRSSRFDGPHRHGLQDLHHVSPHHLLRSNWRRLFGLLGLEALAEKKSPGDRDRGRRRRGGAMGAGRKEEKNYSSLSLVLDYYRHLYGRSRYFFDGQAVIYGFFLCTLPCCNFLSFSVSTYRSHACPLSTS